jgi:hypothetical protein
MLKGYLRNAGLIGLILAVCFVAYQGAAAPPQVPAAGGTRLPDILGITPGMAPQQAYEILKAHDPGHTVALTQWTVPQIYGDKPITLGMSTANTGMEALYVALTMPPNAQVVWQIHRQVPQFTSTKTNVLNSLYQKYGTPFNTDFPGPRNTNQGGLHWYFDRQGHPLNPTTQQEFVAFRNCLSASEGPWFIGFLGIPSSNWGGTTNTVAPGGVRNMIEEVPGGYDPSKHTECSNVIHVQVSVNGGTVRDNELNFNLDFMISDYNMQHRAAYALNDALNTIVAKGAQQERNNASQQSLPKF